VLFFPLVQVGTDILEPLGGLGDFFSLSLGFLFISLLLEPMSKDVEELKLDRCADLTISLVCDD
jgi:hypothetical protein